MTLDILLGNKDRLPCEELGWRGNPENVSAPLGVSVCGGGAEAWHALCILLGS